MLASLLGCQLPILQAPIGGIASPELAAAVANAGGLGALAFTWRSPDECSRLVARTRGLTGRSIQANFVLDFDVEKQLGAALDAGVSIVSLFWGRPESAVARVLAAGGLPLVAIGSVDEAKCAADCGARVIVAQGVEAGGHVRGDLPLAELLPATVEAVPGLPVVAAGGIADRHGVAAAFSLGASGVWVGTRFVASEEADAHSDYQAALIAAASEDTAISTLFDGGWPHAKVRTLRNSTLRRWEEAGCPAPPFRPDENKVAARRGATSIPFYHADAPTRQVTEGAEAMALYAGQGVGLISEVLLAREILMELALGVPPSHRAAAGSDTASGA